jgi:20S proteasome subunit beta 7
MVDPSELADGPRQHTKYPYVTGTSVIGLKYKDGVLIVADTLGCARLLPTQQSQRHT